MVGVDPARAGLGRELASPHRITLDGDDTGTRRGASERQRAASGTDVVDVTRGVIGG